MVCPRCITSVENLLKEKQIEYQDIRLGEVQTASDLSESQVKELAASLQALGFELLNDPASKTIETIKNNLIQKVQAGIEDHFSIQKYLSAKIYKDYSSVSKLFSEVEGITIEQYFILQRVEKAKELIIYDEMTFSDIATFLGYSSSQHFSSQFKRVTGMTPTAFKSLGNQKRKPIDSLF